MSRDPIDISLTHMACQILLLHAVTYCGTAPFERSESDAKHVSPAKPMSSLCHVNCLPASVIAWAAVPFFPVGI